VIKIDFNIIIHFSKERHINIDSKSDKAKFNVNNLKKCVI